MRPTAPRIRLSMVPQAYGDEDDEDGFPEELQDAETKRQAEQEQVQEREQDREQPEAEAVGFAVVPSPEPEVAAEEAQVGGALHGSASEARPGPHEDPSPDQDPPDAAAGSNSESELNMLPRLPHSPWRPRDFVGRGSP